MENGTTKGVPSFLSTSVSRSFTASVEALRLFLFLFAGEVGGRRKWKRADKTQSRASAICRRKIAQRRKRKGVAFFLLLLLRYSISFFNSGADRHLLLLLLSAY